MDINIADNDNINDNINDNVNNRNNNNIIQTEANSNLCDGENNQYGDNTDLDGDKLDHADNADNGGNTANADSAQYTNENDGNNENNENNENTNPTENIVKSNCTINLKNSSVVIGDNLTIYLKTIDGKGIANQKITILLNNKTYTKTTDSKGSVNIKIDLDVKKYQMIVNFTGSSIFNPNFKKFTISVTKSKTKIIVKKTSVVKERNLNLQLTDNKNKPLKNQKLIINFAGKTYTKTTDNKGKISLKISLESGNYTVQIKYNGNANYIKSNKTFKMRVYKLKTSFTVPSTSIIRGKYFYAYLKDKNGVSLANKTVKITFNNKKITKKTDKNGRIRLKIDKKPRKYKLKLKYAGSKTFVKSSKSLTVKSYKAKTKVTFLKTSVKRTKYLHIFLKTKSNKVIANQKLTIIFANKKYKKTTDKKGKVYLKLTKPVGTYKIKIQFNGSKSYQKTSRTAKIKILPNYTAIFNAKNKTAHLKNNKTIRYWIRLTDVNGNPIINETVTIKVKCNNFTSGTGRKITKKTIVLSSDNIGGKTVDKKRLNDMAKILRSKGYKVIVSGIGPNYHVTDVKKYKNVCVFSLVGGIDSGMFVDMADNYYQNYLKKNNNQFVLGCAGSPKKVNLANRTWLVRAHDDDYSPASFKGLYFPGKYLNKKTHVDYVYGTTPEALVNNFLKYAKKGKSIGMNDTIPGTYTTYKLKTGKKGYVYVDLPIGNHTIISSFSNKDKGYTTDTLKTWVNVVK